jgi:hypothetical protein
LRAKSIFDHLFFEYASSQAIRRQRQAIRRRGISRRSPAPTISNHHHDTLSIPNQNITVWTMVDMEAIVLTLRDRWSLLRESLNLRRPA